MTSMPKMMRAGVLLAFAAVAVVLAAASPALAQSALDCFGEDNERRIAGCSDIIAAPGTPPDDLATAYAMRALGYSLKGQYDLALPDYDRAIAINPDFAVALNNRAWAYFKSGRGSMGLVDVEKSLALAPISPHSFDTRAHIRQSMGNVAGALADYEMAMRLGGERMIKLYQCGLQANGLYEGQVDGIYSRTMREALEVCVRDTSCDPLPPDEECRASTS
jgi:tetratricopeptide (TPR) repeat protein